MKIKIPDNCFDCQFYIDSEDDESFCDLLSKPIDKDEEGYPVGKSCDYTHAIAYKEK